MTLSYLREFWRFWPHSRLLTPPSASSRFPTWPSASMMCVIRGKIAGSSRPSRRRRRWGCWRASGSRGLRANPAHADRLLHPGGRSACSRARYRAERRLGGVFARHLRRPNGEGVGGEIIVTERRLAKPRVLAALAAVQAADAAACVGPIRPVKDSLEKVGLPQDIWWLLPVVKTASAAGLIGGIRWSALGRLTTFMLTVYFTLAVGAHLRAHDKMLNALPATSLLALFAVLTAKGFDEREVVQP